MMRLKLKILILMHKVKYSIILVLVVISFKLHYKILKKDKILLNVQVVHWQFVLFMMIKVMKSIIILHKKWKHDFFIWEFIFSYFLVYLDNKRNYVNYINKKLIIKNNQLNSANASSIIYLL